MSKYLVIGGLGFIGSHLCDVLNGEVTIFDKVKTDRNRCYSDNLDELISDNDVVYNLAGILGTSSTFQHVQKTIDTNISFAVSVMQSCFKHNKTLVSTGIPAVPKPNQWCNPYAITKYCLRQFAQMYYEMGLQGCTIIPYHVYGPRQCISETEKLVPLTIYRILNRHPVIIYGSGNQRQDMVYVEDLVECIASIDTFDGQLVHIGSGHGIPVDEIVRMIANKIGGNASYQYRPRRRGEGEEEYISPVSIKCKTSLSNGLDKTIEWYRKNADSVIVRSK